MRFMVMVRATRESEAGEMPEPALLEAMGAYNEELLRAGVLVAGEGLHPSSRGVRVRFSGTDRTVTEGPFDTREVVSGFWIFETGSLEEAIDWVKRCPNPMKRASDIEIRRIFEAEDFGEAMTPDQRDAEGRVREELAREA